MTLQKLEQQMLLWEKAAIIVPLIVTAFLLLFWTAKVFTFEILFFIACGLYFATAIIWWWWTMCTMRYVVRILMATHNGINDVSTELRNIRNEISIDNK